MRNKGILFFRTFPAILPPKSRIFHENPQKIIKICARVFVFLLRKRCQFYQKSLTPKKIKDALFTRLPRSSAQQRTHSTCWLCCVWKAHSLTHRSSDSRHHSIISQFHSLDNYVVFSLVDLRNCVDCLNTKHQQATMSSWANTYFGDQLVTKSGLQSTSEVLKGKKYVGVYFRYQRHQH